METVRRSAEYTLKLAVIKKLNRFTFIFFNHSGFSILHITSWKTKRSSVDSYGMKHCVKLLHYHTYAMRIYFSHVYLLSNTHSLKGKQSLPSAGGGVLTIVDNTVVVNEM